MAPRPPGRPKASDIGDAQALSCVRDYSHAGAAHPFERLASYPLKVVKAKFEKLRGRGLLDAKDGLTEAGRRFLAEREEAKAS